MISRIVMGLIVAACSVVVASEPAPVESRFQLEYRDGTVLTSNFVESKLLWTNVSEFGQMTKQPIEVSRIKSLKLTLEPASEQLAEILSLINNLDSDDFHVRESAEKQLRKNGRRFKSLIERNSRLKTTDGAYRLKRVLSSMRAKPKNQSGYALDILTLTDGTKLTGDAGNKDLEFVFADKTLAVSRKKLARITQANADLSTRPAKRKVVEARLFHDHAAFMKDRAYRMVDFEKRPDGTQLRSLDKNITDEFVEYGLLLGTEYPMGCVGISGYDIKGGDKPVGGNSICVYQSKTRTVKRFQGVMEITFCQPGLKNVPHGVNDIGMFLSRVNHSRDLLVEAYDSMGRLIAVCESNDEPCTFCGISSSIPIARVRVLSNPWVLELRKMMASDDQRARQKVDKDYAVDSIMISSPVPIDSIRKDRHFLGRNGDIIPANWVRVFDADRIELGSQNVKLYETSLAFANTVKLKPTPKTLPKLKSDGLWMAKLRDNSVLKWDPTKQPYSATLKQDFGLEDIVAIWPTGTPARLPLAGDFDSGKHVLVFPGCRVSTPEVDLDSKGYRWQKGTLHVEMLHDANDQKVDQRTNDEPDKVAPRKKSYGFDTSKTPAFEIPTIWFDRPTTLLSSQGAIRLDSGEILAYGKDSLFQLKQIDRKQIVVSFRNADVTIPLSKVDSIIPPQSSD